MAKETKAAKTELPLNAGQEARAIIRYLKISPRKVRLVINVIRHKPVGQAFPMLMALNKKAARFVEKGLKSAVANAKGKGLEESRLVVSEAKADGGPVMKRYMSRSMGRADEILKRSTHLTIAVREGIRTVALPKATEAAAGQQKKEKPGQAKEASETRKKKEAAAAA